MGSHRQTPIRGRHFAFVAVTETTTYHTLLMDGSPLGAEGRAKEMVDRGDSALKLRSVTDRRVSVVVRPMQNKHLEDGPRFRVIVHEDPRDPFAWCWSVPGGAPSIPYPDAGAAMRAAREEHGEADISIQAEGYPGDGQDHGPTPTAAEVLRFLDTFAGQENTAEEVRDFVQLAARYIDERRPMPDWLADAGLAGLVEWIRNGG
jgi:ADP-ribose pyrophosphatase YjhB (NUDIX family)